MLQTDVYDTADLYHAKYPGKCRIVWRYKTNMLLFTLFLIQEYTLSVCIWSRHLKLYSRKWSLIQMSLKKHSLYNLNWSCFEHRVACANKLCRVVLQLLWPCKIIEKSVMGESFFSVLQDLILDLILDSRRNQESWIKSRIETRSGLSTFFWTVT